MATNPELSTGKKLLFAIVTTALFFSAVELGLRLAGFEPEERPPVRFLGDHFEGVFPMVWDDDTFWKLEPHGEIPGTFRERVSDRGFRGPAFDLAKPDGTRRVLCLGDSNVFGMQVPYDATFSSRLERWLNASGVDRWEVINAGVPGYTVYQMWKSWETRLAAVDPDVVVIYAGAWNDFAPAVDSDDEKKAEEVARGAILRGLRIYRALSGLRREELVDPDDEDYLELYREGIRPEGPRLPPAAFDRLLRRLVRSVLERGARPIVLVPPAPQTTSRRFEDSDRYADIVRGVIEREDLDGIDVRRQFEARGDGAAELFADAIHPSVEGHLEIARLLAEELSFEYAELASPERLRGADTPLRTLATEAELEVGPELEEVDTAAQLSKHGPNLVVPCPSRLTFRGVPAPDEGSLVLVHSYLVPRDTPEDRTAPQAELTVRIGPAGRKATIVRRMQMGPTRRPWAEYELTRIDLRAFRGRRVDIVLEASGAAEAVNWSSARQKWGLTSALSAFR